MELTNEFDVSATIDEAWRILTDIELIAPCMPGAKLTEIEGDEYRGSVKVKVGPITANFKGKASFVEQDAGAHRAVLEGTGRDTTGKGNAKALITAQLAPAADGTHVTITTDLSVTGRVAQFGRGAMADVSAKLLGQFVTCLETRVLAGRPADGTDDDPAGTVAAAPGGTAGRRGASTPAGDGPPAQGAPEGSAAAPSAGRAASSPAAATSGPRTIASPEPEPVDLLSAAGVPVVRRVAPVAVALLVLLIIFRRRRGRGRRAR